MRLTGITRTGAATRGSPADAVTRSTDRAWLLHRFGARFGQHEPPPRTRKKASMSASVPTSPSPLKSAVPRAGWKLHMLAGIGALVMPALERLTMQPAV